MRQPVHSTFALTVFLSCRGRYHKLLQAVKNSGDQYFVGRLITNNSWLKFYEIIDVVEKKIYCEIKTMDFGVPLK